MPHRSDRSKHGTTSPRPARRRGGVAIADRVRRRNRVAPAPRRRDRSANPATSAYSSSILPGFPQALDATRRILAVAREHLEMDVAFLSQRVGARDVVHSIEGDGAAFGLRQGSILPADPSPAPDADSSARGWPAGVVPPKEGPGRLIDLCREGAVSVGSRMEVPVTWLDGRRFGSLCCLSHRPGPARRRRDVRFLQGLAHLLAEELQRHETEWRRRTRQVHRIQQVLGEDAIPMAFQPIFDLQAGALVGVEALARFPSDSPPTPEGWFREASAVGMGEELELLAIRSALTALEDLPVGTFMAVNVSPQTLTSQDAAATLPDVPLSRVVLEITEHAPVDDTGAGFASLRHVLWLSPDLIKLDVALTRNIDADPARRAMAASLIAFAEETDTGIVAEGIETTGELDALVDLKVAYGQGYRLGRPGPLEELALAG